ncbi:MAG: hypothetical protein WC340_05080 [Kiritimatiellia bacterium]
MKIVGPPIFACDETGNLKSRIGTVFLKTVGIVTAGPMHILQRQAWIEALNQDRLTEGRPPLTEAEEREEMELSVDLLFDNEEKVVQIRPDPLEMDMSFMADELLQNLVSKSKIVYLNVDNPLVRNRLMMKGEYWRMSQIPFDPVKMDLLLSNSRISINHYPIYFYNKNTGTRFLTLQSFRDIGNMSNSAFEAHLFEIAENAQKRNYHGRPEIDIFPLNCDFRRKMFKTINNTKLSLPALRKEYASLLSAFEAAVPSALKIENVENLAWRNLLFETITQSRRSNFKCEVLSNISPEFYKQIQWLPGASISEDNELIFDKVFDEAKNNPDDKELAKTVDLRAKEFILNYLRQFRNMEYINVGRISRSLSKSRVVDAETRSNVYIVHFKSIDKPRTSLRIIRFQKWGIIEHLKSGHPLLESIFEAVNYTDYIFNRRLACTQLGMNLPKKFFMGRIRQIYLGDNPDPEAYGKRIWTVYFERDYVNGIASDKLPDKYYENPEFCHELARLLGAAGAVNIIVGRASKDGLPMFDDGDEVIEIDEETGIPTGLTVSDHTGTLRNYQNSLFDDVRGYAQCIVTHAVKTADPEQFSELFVTTFKEKFIWTQTEYRKRKRAYDRLFIDMPLDIAGSLAYRWELILKRLDTTKGEDLAHAILTSFHELRGK